jgi:hypothetical protein
LLRGIPIKKPANPFHERISKKAVQNQYDKKDRKTNPLGLVFCLKNLPEAGLLASFVVVFRKGQTFSLPFFCRRSENSE